jgi:steroid 5-alpha reductase family enzyme
MHDSQTRLHNGQQRNLMAEKGGFNRAHASSDVQKIVFLGLHFAIILLCAWLVLFDGINTLGDLFGRTIVLSDSTRASILLACAVIYFVRHGLTLFHARCFDWGDVFGLTAFFALFELGLLLVGGGVFRDAPIAFSGLDVFALVLYLSGSYLHSASEIQRKLWKEDPSNKGHCYTGGLFRYSMHINYFGDVVLFTGWCLLTASYWTLGLPLMMLLMFMFIHIPQLDQYLAERYEEGFEIYRTKTKRLIPFVW